MKLDERIADAQRRAAQLHKAAVEEESKPQNFATTAKASDNEEASDVQFIADELIKLAALRDQGLLSEDEFNSQRLKLLGQSARKSEGAPRSAHGSSTSFFVRSLKLLGMLFAAGIILVFCGPRHQLSQDEQECQQRFKGEQRQRCVDAARLREIDRQTAEEFEKMRKEMLKQNQ